MLPVNLIQFPVERKMQWKAQVMIKLGGAGMLLHPLLHFSLVFVAALSLTDAVLPSPVQDLLELLLLSAERRQDTRVTLKQKAAKKM